MRIFRSPVLYLVSLLLILNYGCDSGKLAESDVVATYDNGHTVKVDELNKYVKDWLYYKKFNNRSDVYNNALNDLLVNQFKRMDFFEKGLDKDSVLIQSISRIINEELVAEYYETQYLGKYVNDENAKKAYGLMNKEVFYQLIELKIPDNASPKQIDSLKEKSLKIKKEIDNGKEFSSLVDKYSQDKTSLENNGFMPPVTWKQSISNPATDAIFRLNKNDVRVLISDNAFMIVKVADIKKIHVEPFDSIKSEILSDLKIKYAEQSLDEYEKDKKELIDAKSLKWNDRALKQIAGWSNIQNFYAGEYKNVLNNELAKGNNKVILTYNKGTVDYKELLRLLDNILVLRDTYDYKEGDMKKYIQEALRTDLIVKKANSLDLKKNIFNAFTNNIALKIRIARLYNQAEVEAKIPEATDEALHKFYMENEDGLYYQLEKVNLFVMVFPTQAEAEEAMSKINSGTAFEKITGRYLVKTYIKDRGGEIKSYLSDEKPTFGKTAFNLKESEVSGPIKFEDENSQPKYAVVKCYHIRPEKQLTFSDVTNSITEDFKDYHRKRIEKKLADQLKSKYRPHINEDVLAGLISNK